MNILFFLHFGRKINTPNFSHCRHFPHTHENILMSLLDTARSTRQICEIVCSSKPKHGRPSETRTLIIEK